MRGTSRDVSQGDHEPQGQAGGCGSRNAGARGCGGTTWKAQCRAQPWPQAPSSPVPGVMVPSVGPRGRAQGCRLWSTWPPHHHVPLPEPPCKGAQHGRPKEQTVGMFQRGQLKTCVECKQASSKHNISRYRLC